MMVLLGMLSLALPPAGLPSLSTTPAIALQRVEDPAATPGTGDGVYGRFDGDFSFRVGLGAEWDMQARAARPLARLDLLGYQTLGTYLIYRQGVMIDDEALNVVSWGVSLSPLFLFRWSRALESGRAYGDLVLDSLTLSAGLAAATPRGGAFAEALGFESALEAGVPFLPRADGPWLRCRLNIASGRSGLGFTHDWGGSVMLLLDWQAFFYVGLLKSNHR